MMAGFRATYSSHPYITEDVQEIMYRRRTGAPYYHMTEDEYFNAPPNPLPLTNQIPVAVTECSEDDVPMSKYVGTGVTIVSLLAENLLSHPFLVLRRQCQVHNNSQRYHLVPFTLIPVMCNLHQHQGLTSLWKGLGSVLLVRGMTLGVEDLVSKVTPWPKEISWHSSLKSFLQHTLLKCVSMAIITPFYSASLVETVQSDIASEKPGILDVFKEGFMRLLNWGGGSKGRMLPIWALVLPTVTLGIARYFFATAVKGVAVRLLHLHQKYKRQSTGAFPKDPTDYNTNVNQQIELSASLISVIASDIVFYPCETVLHRLHLQGTRTIIDNLDTGKSVLPILTNYLGPIDCYESCINSEGTAGLYKGFGALILQYVAHLTVVHITRFLLTEVSLLIRKPPKRIAHDTSPPLISNITTGSTYLLP